MNVLLLCMPFASAARPALGLSTLKARLQEGGVRCDVAYPNLAFADALGHWEYERIADHMAHKLLVGEWVFTQCLYDPGVDPGAAYIDDVVRPLGRLAANDIDVVLAARAAAPGFLADCLCSFSWAEYEVIGFSSSNAQNIASLALAGMVRRVHPRAVIAFGGANWQGVMGAELLRRFPFVDIAFSGEADLSFPAFLRALAAGRSRPYAGVAGVIYRSPRGARAIASPPDLIDMNELPIPDHSDFFIARSQMRKPRGPLPAVTLETTRGCWWAQRHPCGFCGLDDDERVFRSKRPERVVRELRELGGRYDGGRLHLVDNVVAPEFFSRVLPEVAARPLPMPLFFDVRPSVSLDQLRLVGKIHADIQPGIESFSDHVLGLMGKGTRALENIRLLKWCKSCGVVPHWNLIYGFPGETVEDCQAMLDLLPAISFLSPPDSFGELSLDRYSPFHRAPQDHGFHDLRALTAYAYLYPFPQASLNRIAYAFEHECDPPSLDASQRRVLNDALSSWQRRFTGSALLKVEQEDGSLLLLDERPDATQRRVELDELEQALYCACDDIATGDALHSRFWPAAPRDDSLRAAVDQRLASLIRRRLMVTDGDRYLSLAVSERPG